MQEQFDRGYYQAEEDAADQLMALQTEIKATQLAESFMLGYNRGFDDAEVESNVERTTLVEVSPLAGTEVEEEEPIDNPAKSENE
ncbi:hypothetical protein RHMOL_Rhmol10G0224300 [Rhododendron molle]|uniref:Uncharacterized protein n=1 Tax=Rhododendron molle TaxID=49168 RepID=A0ACC0M4U8_RHOML|nr:hypothetical protein RHMOL_Rhmol10G0224300 [Rhododendron molle]